jgi:hypothetical protein
MRSNSAGQFFDPEEVIFVSPGLSNATPLGSMRDYKDRRALESHLDYSGRNLLAAQGAATIDQG